MRIPPAFCQLLSATQDAEQEEVDEVEVETRGQKKEAEIYSLLK